MVATATAQNGGTLSLSWAQVLNISEVQSAVDIALASLERSYSPGAALPEGALRGAQSTKLSIASNVLQPLSYVVLRLTAIESANGASLQNTKLLVVATQPSALEAAITTGPPNDIGGDRPLSLDADNFSVTVYADATRDPDLLASNLSVTCRDNPGEPPTGLPRLLAEWCGASSWHR